MAADTRFTKGQKVFAKDGLKVYQLANFAIAGFSGNVLLADSALEAANTRIGLEVPIQASMTAKVVSEELRRSAKAARPPLETTMHLGVYGVMPYPQLFVLDSTKDFVPQMRDGYECAGSGGNDLRRQFENNLESHRLSWHERAKYPRVGTTADGAMALLPDDGKGSFPVKLIDLSLLATMTLSEMFTATKRRDVGGKIQCLILTGTGVQRVTHLMSPDQGETWRKETADELYRLQ